MAKKPGNVRLPQELKDFKFPTREEMEAAEEKREREEKKRKKKEERNYHKAFIKSGVKAGFTVKQVLWVIKNFARKDHRHWDGRIGG